MQSIIETASQLNIKRALAALKSIFSDEVQSQGEKEL